MVKLKIHAFLSFCKSPKVRINKGFSGLLLLYGISCRARSQSKRATNCATPRYCILYLSELLCSPSCGSRNAPARYSLRRISTAAPKSPSLYPPQAAVRLFAQSKRATNPRSCYGEWRSHSRGDGNGNQDFAKLRPSPCATPRYMFHSTVYALYYKSTGKSRQYRGTPEINPRHHSINFCKFLFPFILCAGAFCGMMGVLTER